MPRKSLLTALVVLLLAAPVTAQTAWDPSGLQMTRSELQEMLKAYEATLSSMESRSAARARTQEEAELIRSRLSEGDIRTGDRIHMIVEGQPTLSDTFNVTGNRTVVLPQIGEVSLAGILRSELQTHLTTKLSAFIRNPVVHARSLIRLGILGSVNRPGYYFVPSELLLTDALMIAGGIGTSADITRMTVERGAAVIWSRANLPQALQEGRTLDQMSIRAGDVIQVPQQANKSALIQTGLIVISGLASVILVAKQLGVF